MRPNAHSRQKNANTLRALVPFVEAFGAEVLRQLDNASCELEVRQRRVNEPLLVGEEGTVTPWGVTPGRDWSFSFECDTKPAVRSR
jgi:hypothetical protein